ncbi:protein rtoA-like [Coturnix japonica]|uniref:protein rtoA-like n=1 Tax=Coturnix japonica TaxID=93934 RepID=UPI0007774358|nr:protein rtoA-like [Coturnix japonica]
MTQQCLHSVPCPEAPHWPQSPEPGANGCCCCSFQQCFVCGEKGATICCAETGCERSFHLPCATDGKCVTQFFGNHRSFCCEHRPQQIVEAAPEPDANCVVCLEPVGDQKSYHTMVCPVCTKSWFHRSCIQRQAMNTGILRFRCPVCGDRVQFRSEMHRLGIQIPASVPTCANKVSCAVQQITHSLANLSTASQEAEGSSYSSPAADNHTSASTSQAVLQSSHSPQLPKCNILSSQLRGGQWKRRMATCKQHQGHQGSSHTPAPGAESSTHRSISQREVGHSSNSAVAERRWQSRQQDTGRTRSRSPLEDRASKIPRLLRRPPGNRSIPLNAGAGSSRHAPASGAESSRRTSGSQWASSNSPRAGNTRCHRQQGTSQRQSHSRLQGLASNSSIQSRVLCGSRLSPAPGAQSSTQSSATQVTSRASRDSRLPVPRRLLQRGQPQERSRSPLDRRASNFQNEAGGSHSGSPRQRRPTQARRQNRNQP